MTNKDKLKKEIIKSNLSEDFKKQLISQIDKNEILEVVKILSRLFLLSSNIMDLFDD